ncbi:MAG TPA: XRE family transcriptional regulator [Thermodesulfobacteriota bacterium]|nr:XRE family transcriptional regulator [Thermodesulfobacteriota bacterium]
MPTKKVDEKSFGAKMEEMRLAQKMSLEQLANLTGLSQRYLRDIEQGIANPSVSVVIQIAKAFSIDSGSFLSAEDEASEKKRMESFFKRTQAYSYKTLTPHAEKKHMKAFLVTIDPKQDHKMVEYRHEGEEFVYVLKGEIEVIAGEKRHLLKENETLHFDSGLAHKLRNLTEENAKLLVVIYTP